MILKTLCLLWALLLMFLNMPISQEPEPVYTVSSGIESPEQAWEYFVQSNQLMEMEGYQPDLARYILHLWEWVGEGNEVAIPASYEPERFRAELHFDYAVCLKISFGWLEESSAALHNLLDDAELMQWLHENDRTLYVEIMACEGANQYELDHPQEAKKYFQEVIRASRNTPGNANMTQHVFYSWYTLDSIISQESENTGYLELEVEMQPMIDLMASGKYQHEETMTLEEQQLYGIVLLTSGLYQEANELFSTLYQTLTQATREKNPALATRIIMGYAEAEWLYYHDIARCNSLIKESILVCPNDRKDILLDTSVWYILLNDLQEGHPVPDSVIQLYREASHWALQDEFSLDYLAWLESMVE